MMNNDDIRTIALNNIIAAKKVIRYNQQFLYDTDMTDSEKRLADIERDVRGAIADCEEIVARTEKFRDSERARNPYSLDINRFEHEIYDQKKMLVAYNHCLRIITG